MSSNRKQIRRAVVVCFCWAADGGTTEASAKCCFRRQRKQRPIRRKCCASSGRWCPGDSSSSWAREWRCFRKSPEVVHQKRVIRKRCGCTAGTWLTFPDSVSADNPSQFFFFFDLLKISLIINSTPLINWTDLIFFTRYRGTWPTAGNFRNPDRK